MTHTPIFSCSSLVFILRVLCVLRGQITSWLKKLRKYFVSIEKSYTFAHAIADMAQLVEQRIRNAWVPGSSPGIGSIVRD